MMLSGLWACDEPALARLLAFTADAAPPDFLALEAHRAKLLGRAEQATVRNGVAILEVTGPLFKYAADPLAWAIGAPTAYETLRRDLQVAVDDPNVRAIMLDVDSPGGETAGLLELAGAIRAVRGRKPIAAYVADLGASAAYLIASAADRIVVGNSAVLGSIGVRAILYDTSARDEARGVRSVEFISSQTPLKRTDLSTDAGREKVQHQVDALAGILIETVAENRGVTVDHVVNRFGKGDVVIGQRAVAAGLADEIGTFESVLADLARGRVPARRPAPTPSPKKAATMSVHPAVQAERERVHTILAADAPRADKEAAVASGMLALAFEAEAARRRSIMMTDSAPLADRERAVADGTSAMEFAERCAAVRAILEAGRRARGG